MGKMNYSLVLRRNPAKKDEPKKYYASAQTTGAFTFQQLSERIADRSTASIADVSLVIKNLLKVMTDELQNGNTVLVDDIGTFRLGFSSKGVAKISDFSTDMIKRVHVVFYPSVALKASCTGLQFEMTTTRAIQAKALKDAKAGTNPVVDPGTGGTGGTGGTVTPGA